VNAFDEVMVTAEDTELLFRLAFKTRFLFCIDGLVKIDQTPSRQVGLYELFYQRDKRVYACMEHMYRKWLALPDVVDVGIRQRIHELCALYISSGQLQGLPTKLCRGRS